MAELSHFRVTWKQWTRVTRSAPVGNTPPSRHDQISWKQLSSREVLLMLLLLLLLLLLIAYCTG